MVSSRISKSTFVGVPVVVKADSIVRTTHKYLDIRKQILHISTKINKVTHRTSSFRRCH